MGHLGNCHWETENPRYDTWATYIIRRTLDMRLGEESRSVCVWCLVEATLSQVLSPMHATANACMQVPKKIARGVQNIQVHLCVCVSYRSGLGGRREGPPRCSGLPRYHPCTGEPTPPFSVAALVLAGISEMTCICEIHTIPLTTLGYIHGPFLFFLSFLLSWCDAARECRATPPTYTSEQPLSVAESTPRTGRERNPHPPLAGLYHGMYRPLLFSRYLFFWVWVWEPGKSHTHIYT